MNTFKILLATAALTLAARAADAGGCSSCPKCGTKVCKVTWEEKTETNHCYKVECEDICIKPFRLPWQMCCEPGCGEVRTVAVLKKVDYECKSCGCNWEVTCVGNNCGGGSPCGGGCTDCAAGTSDFAKESAPRKRATARFALLSLFTRKASPAHERQNSQPSAPPLPSVTAAQALHTAASGEPTLRTLPSTTATGPNHSAQCAEYFNPIRGSTEPK